MTTMMTMTMMMTTTTTMMMMMMTTMMMMMTMTTTMMMMMTMMMTTTMMTTMMMTMMTTMTMMMTMMTRRPCHPQFQRQQTAKSVRDRQRNRAHQMPKVPALISGTNRELDSDSEGSKRRKLLQDSKETSDY